MNPCLFAAIHTYIVDSSFHKQFELAVDCAALEKEQL